MKLVPLDDLVQGDKYLIELVYPESVVGGTWRAQIRERPEDPDPPLAEFTFDTSLAGDGVVVGELTEADTLGLPERAHWDLEETLPVEGKMTRVGGPVRVRRQVTR